MTDRNKVLSAGEWNELIEAVVAAEMKFQNTPYTRENPDAHNGARIELDNARAELRQALTETKFGPNGSAYVTRAVNGTVWVALNRRSRAWMAGDRVEVISAEKAEATYRKKKDHMRSFERRYAVALQQVADLLELHEVVHLGGRIPGWDHRWGLEGGYYVPLHEDAPCVSARGAMKRAWGADWKDVQSFHPRNAAIEAGWDRKLHGARF